MLRRYFVPSTRSSGSRALRARHRDRGGGRLHDVPHLHSFGRRKDQGVRDGNVSGLPPRTRLISNSFVLYLQTSRITHILRSMNDFRTSTNHCDTALWWEQARGLRDDHPPVTVFRGGAYLIPADIHRAICKLHNKCRQCSRSWGRGGRSC
jgi:hypothetical protein